jgi:hypothetical protein
MKSIRRWQCFSLACAAAFFSIYSAWCDPTPGTQPASSPLPVLFDGFEGPALADFWLAGNYGSGLYVPGAIKLSTNYARSGSHCVEITVREGDIAAAGEGDTRVERAELDSGHFPLRGKEAWYGFSMLIPKDFPIVDNRLVISSCKQSDVARPIVAQRYQNGKHTLTVESQGRKETYKLPAISRGEWIDMIFRVRYSTGEDGLMQVWMNRKQVVSYSGPTAEADAKNAFYSKIGLYRDRLKQPMTMYFDNYTMGGSREAVDPARVK